MLGYILSVGFRMNSSLPSFNTQCEETKAYSILRELIS